jgi:dolichyl-phosphate-mannose--protein O-mannosyl transferase
MLTAALLLRIDGITMSSLSARELHNALLAREYYFGSGARLAAWQQHVLQELHASLKPVEPPLLDHFAAWGYHLVGGEQLWIPRLVSVVAWVLAGVVVYLIALRITRREGALVAAALYLFWPYGVVMSRFYMPDPTMVALLLAGALGVIRYWEAPSGRRFLAASGLAAVATFVKPGVALVFLAVLFAVLAIAQRARVMTIVARLLACSPSSRSRRPLLPATSSTAPISVTSWRLKATPATGYSRTSSRRDGSGVAGGR